MIKAPDASATTPYVQSLRLDGRKIQRTWLDWRELSRGATLRFNLGPRPTRWAQGYRPPSFQRGQGAGIGYLNPDAAYLKPGRSTTLRLGVQNLRSRALTVAWSPGLPAGVTLTGPGGNRLIIPARARREVTLTVTAAADAADGSKVADLRLRAAGGSPLPPAVLRVVVARPGDIAPYFDDVGVSRDANPAEGKLRRPRLELLRRRARRQRGEPGRHGEGRRVHVRVALGRPGQPDNITAGGQQLELQPAAGAALGFLGSASNGPSKGTGTITYTDGSAQAYTLDLSDWTLGAGGSQPEPGNVVAVATPYRNNPGGRDPIRTNLFSASVPLAAGKTVQSVTLPAKADLHVFAIAQK